MPTTEPLTNGEIARSLERIEQSLHTVNDKLDNRPTWTDLEKLETQICKDVSELQGIVRWGARIIVGGVLAALLTLVVSTADADAAAALLAYSEVVLAEPVS